MAVSRPQTTDLAKLVEEYRRAFNARDLDAWVQLLDPDIEIEVDSFTLRGIEAARGFAEGIDKTTRASSRNSSAWSRCLRTPLSLRAGWSTRTAMPRTRMRGTSTGSAA
jgi:hypothetical protein